MSLKISNPTKQNWVFHYREPLNNLLATIELDSGRQVEIGHGWTVEQKGKVIEQLERFGARDAAEVHGAMDDFLGILYRDKGQIEESEIRMGHEAVVATQQQRSVREATRAVLGFDRAARKEAEKSKRPPAKTTEVTVRQELAPGSRPTGNEVEFNLGVDPEGRADVALPV